VTLALLLTGCSTFEGPRYRQRYFPGDAASRTTGKLDVWVNVRGEGTGQKAMLRPGWTVSTVQLTGELPECVRIEYAWGDGETSTQETCKPERVLEERHFVKVFGPVETFVRVLSADGKTVIGTGKSVLQVGPGEAMD
jgi:hypothetical protein